MQRFRAAVLVLLVSMAWIACAPTAFAQESAAFARVRVSLWPEYDRPGMLVIYRVTLAEDFVLPGTVRLRIPVSAGQPNAVAEVDENGNLVVAGYERTAEGEWALLTIRARYPVLQVEYYDPIDRDGDRRSYRFMWPGEHRVGEFEIQVQEPAGTREMRTTPASPGAFPGPEGLALHSIDLGAMPMGQERAVLLDWVRDSDAPTVTRTPAAPPPTPGDSATEPAAAPEEPTVGYRLIFAVGAAAVAAIAVYFLLFARSGKATPAASRPASGDKRGRAKRFCSACGKPVHSKDRFCSACGADLG